MYQQNLSSFIWSVAELLRGDYRQPEFDKVILPFTVLQRLNCVLEPTKRAIELPQEHRTVLNFAFITGKIEVRNLAFKGDVA